MSIVKRLKSAYIKKQIDAAVVAGPDSEIARYVSNRVTVVNGIPFLGQPAKAWASSRS